MWKNTSVPIRSLEIPQDKKPWAFAMADMLPRYGAYDIRIRYSVTGTQENTTSVCAITFKVQFMRKLDKLIFSA